MRPSEGVLGRVRCALGQDHTCQAAERLLECSGVVGLDGGQEVTGQDALVACPRVVVWMVARISRLVIMDPPSTGPHTPETSRVNRS